MDVVVAGGTGLVGGHVLAALAVRPGIDKVTAIGRRSSVPGPARAASQHVVDLLEPSSFAGYLSGQPVICALGTTIRRAGSRPAFRRVDHEMVVTLATAAASRGCRRFMVVSSVGADPDSRNFYLRVKGEMESDLSRVGCESVGIFRPSLILGDREVPRVGERLLALTRPFLWGQYQALDALHIGRALVESLFLDFAGVRRFAAPEIMRLATRPSAGVGAVLPPPGATQ